MYSKSTGSLVGGNGIAPVAFLPGFRIGYRKNIIRIQGFGLTPDGVKWPPSGRLRTVIKALNENDLELMNSAMPPVGGTVKKDPDTEIEISVGGNGENASYCFELDTGVMRIFDGGGTDVEFAGARDNDKCFLFRGKGIKNCRVIKGEWNVEECSGFFRCASQQHIADAEVPVDEWDFIAAQSRSWWGDLYGSLENSAVKDQENRAKLASAICQFGMFPENTFYFDGNFSGWCRAARRLKLPLILRSQLEKICRMGMAWNSHAKRFTGIDDGLWLPARSDRKGDPLELDWRIALDCSSSCIAAVEMFDYCNELFDMNFLEKYAFNFMKGVMRTVELLIVPGNFSLHLPCCVMPGARSDSLEGWGANADRQLFYIHALNSRLLKASDLLGVDPDPVWRDIASRLPTARGEWQLPVSEPWGRSGETICSIIR